MEAGLRALQWDGKDLPAPEPAAGQPEGAWLPLIYYAPGDGVALKLRVQLTCPFRIWVWAVNAGLPALPEIAEFLNDPMLLPVANATVTSQSVQAGSVP
jgi:hypothetical protein